MARVELALADVEDLEDLIRTHSLPADTRAQVAWSLPALERFPLMGPALSGRWEGFRFLLGPWRWLRPKLTAIGMPVFLALAESIDAGSGPAGRGWTRDELHKR